MIENKLRCLSNSGFDLSGQRRIEFEFYMTTKVSLDKLFSKLNVQDGSAQLIRRKLKSGGYSLRVRCQVYCNSKHIGEWLSFYAIVGSECNAILENWRFVVRT